MWRSMCGNSGRIGHRGTETRRRRNTMRCRKCGLGEAVGVLDLCPPCEKELLEDRPMPVTKTRRPPVRGIEALIPLPTPLPEDVNRLKESQVNRNGSGHQSQLIRKHVNPLDIMGKLDDDLR